MPLANDRKIDEDQNVQTSLSLPVIIYYPNIPLLCTIPGYEISVWMKMSEAFQYQLIRYFCNENA